MPSECRAIVITVTVQSSPAVFDLSGAVPFSIKVCVVRRNTSGRQDPDSRPISILVERSLLDVPFALKTGLISVVEFDDNPGSSSVQGNILDFNDLDIGSTSSNYITVDSPTGFNHTGQWAYKDRFVATEHTVLPNSQIGSRFRPGKRYDVRLKDKEGVMPLDFPSRWWNFSDLDPASLPDALADAVHQPDGWQLQQSSSRIGQSHFSTRMSVSIPPVIDVKLSWGDTQTDLEPLFTCKDTSTILATITNRAKRPVTVQCYGDQHFVDPRKRIEPSQGDTRPRITAEDCSVTSLFQVTDLRTGRICKEAKKPASSHGGSTCRLPESYFLLFESGIAETRKHRLDWPIFDGLEPGRYKLTLIAHGAWWSWKSAEELCGGETGHLSTYGGESVAPVMLDSADELIFTIRPM